jgi:hypothetical protein
VLLSALLNVGSAPRARMRCFNTYTGGCLLLSIACCEILVGASGHAFEGHCPFDWLRWHTCHVGDAFCLSVTYGWSIWSVVIRPAFPNRKGLGVAGGVVLC